MADLAPCRLAHLAVAADARRRHLGVERRLGAEQLDEVLVDALQLFEQGVGGLLARRRQRHDLDRRAGRGEVAGVAGQAKLAVVEPGAHPGRLRQPVQHHVGPHRIVVRPARAEGRRLGDGDGDDLALGAQRVDPHLDQPRAELVEIHHPHDQDRQADQVEEDDAPLQRGERRRLLQPQNDAGPHRGGAGAGIETDRARALVGIYPPPFQARPQTSRYRYPTP